MSSLSEDKRKVERRARARALRDAYINQHVKDPEQQKKLKAKWLKSLPGADDLEAPTVFERVAGARKPAKSKNKGTKLKWKKVGEEKTHEEEPSSPTPQTTPSHARTPSSATVDEDEAARPQKRTRRKKAKCGKEKTRNDESPEHLKPRTKKEEERKAEKRAEEKKSKDEKRKADDDGDKTAKTKTEKKQEEKEEDAKDESPLEEQDTQITPEELQDEKEMALAFRLLEVLKRANYLELALSYPENRKLEHFFTRGMENPTPEVCGGRRSQERQITTLLATAFQRALLALFRGEEVMLDEELRLFALDMENAKLKLLEAILIKKQFLPLNWGGRVVVLRETERKPEHTVKQSTLVKVAKKPATPRPPPSPAFHHDNTKSVSEGEGGEEMQVSLYLPRTYR